MKILETYDDGSQTILYEPGDRVVFTRHSVLGGVAFAKQGETGTVISRDQAERESSISFLRVQTDAMKAGGWGTVHAAPWELELEAK
jgi:hypothetical protein